jgi:putative phosphonate catabolism associated alcohol dehydrogenase
MQFSKTALFISPDEPLQISDILIPATGDGEILVKNEYTTLCRSDLNTFCGKRIEKTPTILGHEVVGRIISTGKAAPETDIRGAQLNPGDRITWAIFASDPASEMAKKGIPQKATGLFKYGHEKVTSDSTLHGGLSQFTLLRKNTPVIKISENIPLPVAATINCAVATVAGAIRLAGEIKGKNILVSGTGMLGITACAMCRANSAKTIFAIDIDEERKNNAKLFGADKTATPFEMEKLEVSVPGSSKIFDVVLEFSGIPATMEQTLDYLVTGGMAVWVGATFPARSTRLDAEKIVRNLITIKGLHNYNEDDLVTAVQFMEENHSAFPFDSLVYNGFSLDEVNEAFHYALTENPFRAGIQID